MAVLEDPTIPLAILGGVITALYAITRASRQFVSTANKPAEQQMPHTHQSTQYYQERYLRLLEDIKQHNLQMANTLIHMENAMSKASNAADDSLRVLKDVERHLEDLRNRK